MRKYALIIAVLLSLASEVLAADWYVRKGAAGSNNGADWTNAWNEMNQIDWASVSAGDTIWLAGGTYTTAIKPGKSGTSGSRIYVKRVRATDSTPAAAAGWNVSYDAQVILDVDFALSWDSGTAQLGSYVTIDGRIDSGIKTEYHYTNWASSALYMNTANTGVTIQYVDMRSQGGTDPVEFVDDLKVVQLRANAASLTISHCRMHGGVDQIMILGPTDLTIEYSKLYDNKATNPETHHPGMVASRTCYGTTTFRHNELYNFMAEGLMLGASGGDVGCAWQIYGNVVYGGGETARFVELQYVESTVTAYNNTLSNLSIGFRAINGATWGAGSAVQNNILYNITAPFSDGTTGVHDYNASEDDLGETHDEVIASTIFTDYENDDYTLASGTTAGATLSSPYDVDPVGSTRGQDGTWDRGAYEYGSDDTTLAPRMTGSIAGSWK